FLPVLGGAEIGALELARRLTARGHAVSVVTPQLDPAWPRQASMDGVGVHRYPVPGLGGRDRTANIALASFLHLGRLWRELAPDVACHVVPSGVDAKQSHPHATRHEVRSRHGLPADARLVLTVQRLYARKGVTTFLDAAALVAPAVPAARFVIVGDGPERAAL